MLFLAMAGAIWGFGALIGLPRRGRAFMIAGLYGVVLLAHGLGLAALARGFGGSFQSWLVLGGVFGLIAVYGRGVRALKSRAITPQEPEKASFSATELDRYSRHILLREIGGTGQKKLKNARVLVVGAGGLGAPALLYLAGAGVGVIGVVDPDTVSNSNLQRQILHRDADIGAPKVFSALRALTALNPFIEIRPYHRAFAPEMLADYDLVLDGSDNFATRHQVNSACVAAGKPLIYGALSQWEGQISLAAPNGPCYACLFPVVPAEGLAPACAEAGVMAALPGVIGAMMAAEAIKTLTGAGRSLQGRLYIYDALWGESREIAVTKTPDCPVCGEKRSLT